MVERSDQFRTLNSDAALVPLKSNVRPAFVLDRTGRRVLWANAAGLSFNGVETLTDLADQAFSPDQPFVARASLLAGNLAEGTARLEKLRFPGRFRAMPYTCQVKSLKLAAPDGSAQKALLVTMLDGPAFGGSPAEAENRLATFLAADGAPETWPDATAAILPEDESAAIDVAPATDEVPADIGVDAATTEAAPAVDEPTVEAPDPIIEANDIGALAEAAAEDTAAFSDSAVPVEETTLPASTEMIDAGTPGEADVADVSLAEADQFAGSEEAKDIASEVAAATLSDDGLSFSLDNEADDDVGHAQPDEQPAEEFLASETSVPVEVENHIVETVEAEDQIGETVEAELPAEIAEEQVAEESAIEAAPEAENPVMEPVIEGLGDAGTADAFAAEEAPFSDMPPAEVAPADDTETDAVDAGDLETASPAPFAFTAHDRPVRFVFELDEATRFGFVSPELAETIGPLASPSLGESWDEAAERLKLDTEGKVTKALGRRDTFTGATVRWPVQDADFAVAVGLSGMPVFGRDRSFRGYRGFGICRTGETFATDGVIVPTAIPAPPETAEPEAAESPADEAGSTPVEIASPADAADMTSEVSEAFVQQDLAMSEELAVDETPAPEAVASAEPIEEEAPADVAGAETEEAGQAVVDEIAPETATELDASNEAASADEALSATEGMVEALPPDVVFVPDEAVEDIALAPEEPATSEPASRIETADMEADASAGQDIGAQASDADNAPDMPQPTPGSESATSTQPDFFLGSMPISLDDARSAIRAAGKSDAGESDTGNSVETVSALPGDAPEERPVEGEATSSAPEVDAPATSQPSAVESDDDARGAPAPASTSTPAVTVARPTLVQQQAPSAKVIPSPMIARPVPVPMTDGKQLSRPEREAFRQIAEALGARYEGPTGEDEAPAATQRATGYTTTTVARNARAANAPSGATLDVSVIERLPVALAIFKDGNLISMNSAFLALCGYDSRADFEAAGGIDAVITDDVFTTAGNPIKLRVAKNQEIAVNVTIHKIQHNGAPASMMVFDRRASSAEANGEKAVEAPAPSPAAEAAAEASQDSASEALLQRTLDAETRIGELDAILDTATDGVLVIDGQGEILNCNRSAEALFGQEKANIIGRRLVDILAPESHRSALDYLDGLARNGVASVLNDGREVIGTVGSGGYIPLFMTMGRVGADKFCAVLRDITHWKRVEEELTSAKRQAETASSQKSEFLAKMSHEIRTPLNAIIGFSEVMMEERFGPVGNERYKEYLRDIRLSGTHIMSLVNDLLDLSKIEAGKMDLSFTAVSINDILRDCVALMQPQANRERIIIRTSLSSTVPHVVADERSVRQIVLNLLSNAIKFTPQSGQVIVSTIYDDTGEVAVRVRDTGDGMSAAEIQKALEPFRQLHTARSGSGTGLGLPLTKALVEANRAHFRIESAPGQGTLVEITFPSTRVLAE